jgi:nucleotide-binding universal stress UspA family protein
MWIVEVLDPDDLVGGPDLAETSYVAGLAHRHHRTGVPMEWDVIHAHAPAEGIDRYLREIRPNALAIMGTHGRSGWSALRLGSVAMRAVHGAVRPVVLVPGAERETG